MNKDVYKKAKILTDDIKSISRIVSEVEEDKHWVKVVTPRKSDEYFSSRFQKDLLDFLKKTRENYEKEFEELD